MDSLESGTQRAPWTTATWCAIMHHVIQKVLENVQVMKPLLLQSAHSRHTQQRHIWLLASEITCHDRSNSELKTAVSHTLHTRLWNTSGFPTHAGHSVSVLVKNMFARRSFDSLLMPKAFAAHTALDRQNPCQSDVKLNAKLYTGFLIQ